MSTEETTTVESQIKAPETESSKATNTKASKPTTVVAKKAINKDNCRYVIVAIGQGGANIGSCLQAALPNKPVMIAVNTSAQDLNNVNVPEDFKFAVGGDNVNGAGKQRAFAKDLYLAYKAPNVYNENQVYNFMEHFIGIYEEVLFHPTEQTIIFTVFSSDGGTGSGIGPILTEELTRYMNSVKSFQINKTEFEIDDRMNNVPRPVVISLTTKCAINAGVKNLNNNIECFVDINKMINSNRPVGHFFIADNNLPSNVEYNNIDEMYKIINARIVAPFVKFLGMEMNSSIKCLDLRDKINTLRIPGCSSFASLTKENQFAYTIPRGQAVTRTILMLRHDVEDLGKEEANAKNMLNANDIASLDTITAFFDLGESGLMAEKAALDLIGASMAGFFGFRSLSNIVEDLRDNLHRTMIANDKRQHVVEEHSTGFSTVEADSEELNSRFGL